MLPTKMILTQGSGSSYTSRLNAFDMALFNAGVANYNHVKLSSIIPPRIEVVHYTHNLENYLPPEGSILHGVMAEMRGEKGDNLFVSLALAFNKNKDLPGMIFELSGDSLMVETRVALMAQEGMALRGWEISNLVIKSSSLLVTSNHGCVISYAAML